MHESKPMLKSNSHSTTVYGTQQYVKDTAQEMEEAVVQYISCHTTLAANTHRQESTR